MAVLCTGDLFSTIEEARDLINRSIIDKGESYKVVCSNKKSHVLCCHMLHNMRQRQRTVTLFPIGF